MRAVFDDNLVTGNEMIDGQHKGCNYEKMFR